MRWWDWTWLAVLAPIPGGCASRPQVVVSAEWVRQNPRARIVEVGWDGDQSARKRDTCFIPGAVHADTDAFENGYPQWRLRPLKALHDAIGKLGITPRDTVVVYGRQTIAAARVWWILHYAGVRDARVLDGGIAAWRQAGFPCDTKPRAPSPAVFEARPRSGALATTDYVRRTRGRIVLADVRSRDEFLGIKSGYSYLDRKGRIPGAVHMEDAGDSSANYQTADGAMRAPAEIERLWRSRGLTRSGSEVVFYCGGGWRSSLAFLYAYALGFSRIRNYSDGWSGWSTIYEEAPGYGGSTPGWRQRPTENAVTAQ